MSEGLWVWIDPAEYSIETNLSKILGILTFMPEGKGERELGDDADEEGR